MLGDDLYAHEAFCRETLKSGYSFIFVAKEDSHKIMYEHINFIEGIGEIDKHKTIEGNANKKENWSYKFVNEVPINGKKDREDFFSIVRIADLRMSVLPF